MLGKWPSVASRREQHDVAVEDRPGGVADRVVQVVALDQHRVEAGDAAGRAGAGPLEQPGQQGEDAAAGSRGWRAARRPTGRSRAAPSRRGSGCPSSARRSLPWSRNHSAMRVATNAARSRTTGGASEVATTTTERARPSGPRSFSMNSRTSRPRSPTSASTETSASVPRAIIDSRLDLPTPEPAKMPSRWPRPHGVSVSIARTPRPTCWSIRGRLRAAAASLSTTTSARPARARAAVDRAAESVEDAAEQRVADADLERAAGVADGVADAESVRGGRAAGRSGRRDRWRRPRRGPARGRPPRPGRRPRRAGR